MAYSQQSILPGFEDPVHDSNAVFRRVLDATSHPGRLYACCGSTTTLRPPPPLKESMTAILLALADRDAPLYLEPGARLPEVQSFLRFHTGARIVEDISRAAFVVITDAARLPHLSSLPQGTDIAPETGCTLLVEVDELHAGSGFVLTGPGIKTTQKLDAAGLPPRFWAERLELESRYPRGIDVVFTAGRMLAALPRTTKVEF